MRGKRGLTFIELIMFIIIASIAFLPVIMIFGEVVKRSSVPEILSVATSLAEKQMDNLTGLGYDNITNSSGTLLTDYTYEAGACFVDANDLDTCIVGTTDYKQVQVTVKYKGATKAVLTTLLTKYAQ